MAPINRILIGVIFLNLLVAVGCHRGYYRRQADAEVQRLVLEKAVDPRWDSATGSIAINPASRMFDPFSADHPPIPPDDATSHQLMHYVDGKEGYPRWNANGDTNYVANPEWQKYLKTNEEGKLVLTLDAAFELALLHSTEYQEVRETLYLSALDVSLDRFGFDSQLLWGVDSFGELTRGNTSLDRSGSLDLNKLGITGTNFAVGLANTILFNFGGSDSQTASTLLDFSLIQPLLRGAGRARVMEALTQSERTLLANVRQFDRYRRNFYLNIALGKAINARLSRGGGFLNNPGDAGNQLAGFTGLLQDQQTIRNAEFNLIQQRAVVERFRELFLRQQITPDQLTTTESSFYRAQTSLLRQQVNYQNSVDRFKRTLGLPPTLDIVIDDTYLEPFELISDQIFARLKETTKIREQAGNFLNTLDAKFYMDVPDPTPDDEENVKTIQIDFDDPDNEELWPTNLADLVEDLTPILETAQQQINSIINDDIKLIEADIVKLNEATPRRIEYLKRFQEAVRTNRIETPIEKDSDIFDLKLLKQAGGLQNSLSDPDDENSVAFRIKRAQTNVAQIINNVKNFRDAQKQQTKQQTVDYIASELQNEIPTLLSDIDKVANDLILLQASARGNSIELIDVSINSEEATQIARCMRRDWMNARASLVDSWRNIEFVANRLEAQVDLVFDGDIRTRPDASNPFKLRYDTGNLRAGFRFDAPIVRLSERNSYRNALINYQQSKRRFYEFEDSVSRNLRATERALIQNKTQFEFNRLNLKASLETVEFNNLNLDAPAQPNRSSVGLSRDITQGINSLTQAQDGLLSTWLLYQVARRNLDFDMGTMLLDENGRGIDPGPIDSMIGQRAAEALGIEIDCQFCDGVAAPGFVAPPLDSSDLPSVVDPQLDNQPAAGDENQSSRNDFVAPKLGSKNPTRPTSVLTAAAPEKNSQTVSQLLTAMRKDKPSSPLKKLEEPRHPELTSRQNEKQRNTTSRIPRSSQTLDPANLFKTGIIVEPLNQSDADSRNTQKPTPSPNNLSAGKVYVPNEKIQTTQLAPIEVVATQILQPIKAAKNDQNTNVVVRAYHNPVDERENHARHVDLKMIAIHNPSPAKAIVKDATLSEQTHWQSQPSSLGGLLNRFSTEASN